MSNFKYFAIGSLHCKKSFYWIINWDREHLTLCSTLFYLKKHNKNIKYLTPKQWFLKFKLRECTHFLNPFLVLAEINKFSFHLRDSCGFCSYHTSFFISFRCQLLPFYIKDKACKWCLNVFVDDGCWKSQMI